jgi:hypothetical protein
MCITILVAANVSIYRAVFAPHALRVSVLEVGKGNATLVRTPGNMLVLVNAGPDASILRALGRALPPWRRSIDAVILTSTKASSVGGLPEVESRYRISARIRIGDAATPYGSSLTFDNGVRVEIIAPATLTVSDGTTSFNISSSTLMGVYTSNGRVFTKTK